MSGWWVKADLILDDPEAPFLLLDILTEFLMVLRGGSPGPLPAAASLRGSLASGGTADGFFREASACGGSVKLRESARCFHRGVSLLVVGLTGGPL